MEKIVDVREGVMMVSPPAGSEMEPAQREPSGLIARALTMGLDRGAGHGEKVFSEKEQSPFAVPIQRVELGAIARAFTRLEGRPSEGVNEVSPEGVLRVSPDSWAIQREFAGAGARARIRSSFPD